MQNEKKKYRTILVQGDQGWLKKNNKLVKSKKLIDGSTAPEK
jgi:hypothetical protein